MRDWANLADGPAGIVADRVLAYDVADYVRAHGGLDRRFHPWRWTMLREEVPAPARRSFLNTSTGECVPELRDHELLAVTPEGLLVLVHKQPLTAVRLLNPLTRHLVELPPLTTLLPSTDHHMVHDRDPRFSADFAAGGSGIAHDDSTVVLCLHNICILGVAKPGDDRWTLLKFTNHGMVPLMLAGRFYCVDLDHGVMVLDTSPDHPPRMEVAASLNMPHVSSFWHGVHLFDNFGELMLVHRRNDASLTVGNDSGWQFDAYRVDLDTGTLFPVKSLGGNAVFMGMGSSLSVSPDVFPSGSISGDTIYLGFDVAGRCQFKVGAYHLMDGSIERGSRYWRTFVGCPHSVPCPHTLPCPYTLVDCLSLSNTV